VSASPTDLTLLADLRRPVTRADALAAGVSPSMIKGSRFRRIYRGVYISSAVSPDALHRVAGALLLHPPSAFASHLSAARVYGLLSRVDLVVVGDALCRLRLATPASLVAAAQASRSTRAITAAS
jgi:hypothetical protein